MHDVLFEHQDALEDEDLLVYANMLRLDIRRFNMAITSSHRLAV